MLKLIVLLVLFFSQIVSITEEDSDMCEKNNQKSAELVDRYYLDNNPSHLDSALFYIDEVLGSCEKLDALLSLRKLGIYSFKKEYSEALLFIEKFEENMFSDLPYFQSILINRFKAMQSQSEGNIIRRDSFLQPMIMEIDTFLSINEKKVDSLLKLTDFENILKSPLSTAITQYYYYRSIIEGFESVEAELVNKQNSKGGNEEFFNYLISFLHEDFMIFAGI